MAAAPSGGGTTVTHVPRAEPTAPPPTLDAVSPDSALIAGGVLLLSVALAGAILLTSLPPVLAIAPILLGLFVAALIRRTTPLQADPFSVATPLPAPAATRGTGVSINAPTATQLLQGEAPAEQTSAIERRAVATDPADQQLDAPSGDDVRNVLVPASGTAAVRAATQFASTARLAWETAWTELGASARAEPVTGPALDAALAELQERLEAAEPSPVVAADIPNPASAGNEARSASREHLDELLAGRSLDAVLATEPGPPPLAPPPLVLVEPFVGLDDERRAAMRSGLEALAGHHEVIVIVQAGSDNPFGVDS
jgi:hypothetical protein